MAGTLKQAWTWAAAASTAAYIEKWGYTVNETGTAPYAP